MIIAVDFDGTIVEHRYPDIGPPVPGALEWLRRFQSEGARLILWTMRSDSNKEGPVLTAAGRFCRDAGIQFWGVNVNPTQSSWTSSPKVYAHICIDDTNAACPLVYPPSGARPYVDWSVVGPWVWEKLTKKYQRAKYVGPNKHLHGETALVQIEGDMLKAQFDSLPLVSEIGFSLSHGWHNFKTSDFVLL